MIISGTLIVVLLTSNDDIMVARLLTDVCTVDQSRRYDTVDLYSRVNSTDLLRLAFQACDQTAAFLSTYTVVA